MWLFGVARRVLANAARGDIRRSGLADRLRAHLETLPVSETTARGRYQRARARLRALLREHQYEGTNT